MKVHMRTDFVSCECSDLGVGGWVSCNLNVVCTKYLTIPKYGQQYFFFFLIKVLVL